LNSCQSPKSEVQSPKSKVLILTDGKAGHENQSKAFARALGCDFDLVEVHFRSAFHKALSYAIDWLGLPGLWTLDQSIPKSNNQTLKQSNDYRAVLGTGSGTFYAAKSLARKLGAKCCVVLYPRGYRISIFDCVLAPAFDRPAPAPNVVEIPANLVANDAAFYEAGTAAFLARHPVSDRPAVAVIVGGPNKCSTMSADWMRAELTRIFTEHGHPSFQTSEVTGPVPEFWVTTSRRTPPEVEAVVDSFPFDYKLLYSKDHFNPIPAFVSRARTLYVTAESTGMLSEACTFGTSEVRVLDNLNPGPHKFRRFAESCAALGARKIDLSEQFAAARKLLAL